MGLVCGVGNRVASNAYAKHVNPWLTYRLIILRNKPPKGIDDSTTGQCSVNNGERFLMMKRTYSVREWVLALGCRKRDR